MLRFTILLLSVISVLDLRAQVVIGDNPSSVHPNAVLELQSPDKGLLLPRVPLADALSSSPLQGTVPAGMMVYSQGGGIADGSYVWNGNQWQTSTNPRINCVMVKSESDFPESVNGVIQLAKGTLYQINGLVMVTNKINLNGCTIQGLDRPNDLLIYTGPGELFTGAFGGALHNMIVSAVTPGARIFNIDAVGALENLIIDNVFLLNSSKIGHIKNFGGFVVFNNCAYSNNQEGMILENIHDVLSLNEFWLDDNRSIFQKFVGVFHTIQKNGGRISTLAANSAVGLDISQVTDVEVAGYIKNNIFCGTGTYVVGSFSNKWEIESFGVPTEKDDVASGNIYNTAALTTNFTGINTPVKVATVTQAVGLFRVDSDVNNQLEYTGSRPRRFLVNCSLTFVSSGNNKVYSFYISKNGVILPESKISRKVTTGTDQGSLGLSCTVQMNPHDYIEVWVENNTDNSGMTVLNMNLAIK
jgi:hypothetical protein